MKPSDLTNREGKTLRFYVGRTKHGPTPATTEDCIVETPWSDLPHNIVEASATVSRLKASRLLKRSGKGWLATQAGIKLVDTANAAGEWKAPPPPSVTNVPEHIDPVLKDYKSPRKTTKKRGK